MLSVVIPVYNNEPTLVELYQRLKKVLEGVDRDHEIIFIDDGSRDQGLEILKSLVDRDDRVRMIKFSRNFGQSRAVLAGIEKAEGDIIVTLDADLQYDPQDILKLLKKIEEGYEVAFGWRRKRKDSFFLRRLPSLLANIFVRIKCKSSIKDIGCSLIALKRDIALRLKSTGNRALFIKPLLIRLTDSFDEVEVEHYPRKNGKSQYTTAGLIKLALDFIFKYEKR